MNLLMIWLIIWRWETYLTQMMIMKPTEISKSKILRTIKTHTITACWLECKQTTGCESVGTDSDNEKKNDLVFDCYLFGSRESKRATSKETPLKVTETTPVNVSYFEFFYSIIFTCFLIVSCSFRDFPKIIKIILV